MSTLRNIFITCSFLASCTAIKPPVSGSLEGESTRYHVKGLQGWMIKQQLSFAPYKTSVIKRGWDFSRSVQYTKFNMSPEETILKVFDIDTDKHWHEEKSKFQYTIGNGSESVDVYGAGQFSEKQLVYKSNNPFIGNASKTLHYEYSFTAILVPLWTKEEKPWSLVMIDRYDSNNDTARRLMDRPYVEQEGYATDGGETIALTPVHQKGVSGLLSGYELQTDGMPLAFVDIINDDVRIGNDLSPRKQLILASIATAILVRRSLQNN